MPCVAAGFVAEYDNLNNVIWTSQTPNSVTFLPTLTKYTFKVQSGQATLCYVANPGPAQPIELGCTYAMP
jgi:hypothetical protein